MRKTNKWVPEWVIRRAIAHLPQPPCRCACHGSRVKKESPLPGKPGPCTSGLVLNYAPLRSQLPPPAPES